MPKVASEVKAPSPSNVRHSPRPADKTGSNNPFAALLDSAAQNERPAPSAKSDRAAPAKEADKSDSTDSMTPADDSASANTDAASPSAETAETTAAAKPSDAKTDDTDTVSTDAVTQTTDADLLAALTTPDMTQPAPQPVAAVVITPVTPFAPVAAIAAPAVADAETADAAVPAIEAAAAPTVPADVAEAAPVQPQAASKTDKPEKADGKPQAKADIPAGTDQSVTTDATAAQKQPDDAPQSRSDPQHRDAKAEKAEPQVVSPETKQVKADADLAPKGQAATPATDGTPSITLTPIHSHNNVAAVITAQNATQVASAVPVNGIALEITTQAKAGGNRFEIRLDPPELGRIDVRLEVSKDGQVTSHLRVDRVETLDMLRRDSANLERALQDAGLKTSDNALNFSLRDQSFRQQGNDQGPQYSSQYIATDETMPDVGGTQASAWTSRLGGLDIRV